MIFTGKNTDFKVIWNCAEQSYSVYKNNKFIVRKFRYSDIKCYLD